jgi:hypothetical protein
MQQNVGLDKLIAWICGELRLYYRTALAPIYGEYEQLQRLPCSPETRQRVKRLWAVYLDYAGFAPPRKMVRFALHAEGLDPATVDEYVEGALHNAGEMAQCALHTLSAQYLHAAAREIRERMLAETENVQENGAQDLVAMLHYIDRWMIPGT